MTHHLVTETFGRDPWLRIGSREFQSRLLVGIELYTSAEVVGEVLRAAHADVFITTYDLEQTRSSLMLSDLDGQLDLDSYLWVGTTSFARSVDAAVETAQRLRASMGLDIIKLDVRNAQNLPCAESTIQATKELLADGFVPLPLVQPDLRTASLLADAGCPAIRLLASPVGSYAGVADVDAVRECLDGLPVPVVLEGGMGSPAHVAQAMELGASAVLVNTLIARSANPAVMATAVFHAMVAGGMAARARHDLVAGR
ncbi:thiamine biosynthesis protein ThiG [Plantactinospora sp. S1510]|uniref:thiazole synthase n=1 Tax=Plantactinospora alkalitolerans TaxID=2789879 RepID=A0ABS0H1Z5_9ACTN|nr:thiamine biosynthesis protein ThiG [Plantactinospora alkalitolerans]MBF9132204.1 thiamine biosynthesis protein ThiG [Plantactinospora alkalitolerans]